jgi:hypothetical protein
VASTTTTARVPPTTTTTTTAPIPKVSPSTSDRHSRPSEASSGRTEGAARNNDNSDKKSGQSHHAPSH